MHTRLLQIVLLVVFSSCHSSRHSHATSDISLDSTAHSTEVIASTDWSTIFSQLSLRLDSLSLWIEPTCTEGAPPLYRVHIRAKQASLNHDSQTVSHTSTISQTDVDVNHSATASIIADSQSEITAMGKPPDMLFLIIGIAFILMCILVYKHK